MTKTEQFEGDGCFVRLTAEHERENTVQHWQLRDLLAFGKDDRHIFTVNRNRILKYDLTKRKSHDVSINYLNAATTIAVNEQFLASGTDHGELQLFSLAAGAFPKRLFSSVVTHNHEVLNNLSMTSSDHGAVRLYASGNDRTVRCYSVPDMVATDCLQHTVPVNCCGESPDGSMLMTVGDHEMGELYKRDSSGRFVRHDWLRSSAHDAGMSCAWHPWGNCVAAAFQCGRAVVWDIRSGKVVAEHHVKTAVRSVKFSAAPSDLLAFTEHESKLHVVDARKYQSRHSLNVGSEPVGLSGLAFSPKGDRVFVGLENKGIHEFSIDGAARFGFSDANCS